MTLNLSTLYGNVGPANSDIATAVSSSTAVQSMVGTQVTNNAPSPASWTFIGSLTPASVSSASFTNISGYKRLKIVGSVDCLASGAGYLWMQFNNDTGTVAYQSGQQGQIIDAGGAINQLYVNRQAITLSVVPNYLYSFNVDIDNANSTSVYKWARTDTTSYSPPTGTSGVSSGSGLWKNTAAITSIKITGSNGAAISGTLYLLGQN